MHKIVDSKDIIEKSVRILKEFDSKHISNFLKNSLKAMKEFHDR